jgi:hypothetical protein
MGYSLLSRHRSTNSLRRMIQDYCWHGTCGRRPRWDHRGPSLAADRRRKTAYDNQAQYRAQPASFHARFSCGFSGRAWRMQARSTTSCVADRRKSRGQANSNERPIPVVGISPISAASNLGSSARSGWHWPAKNDTIGTQLDSNPATHPHSKRRQYPILGRFKLGDLIADGKWILKNPMERLKC